MKSAIKEFLREGKTVYGYIVTNGYDTILAIGVCTTREDANRAIVVAIIQQGA